MLQHNLRIAIFTVPIIRLSFAIHEMAHAFAANVFGDPTPREHGRITLNPIRHLIEWFYHARNQYAVIWISYWFCRYAN